jgi:hypothetical protein
MSNLKKNVVRDAHIDYLVKKVHIPALSMCTNAATTSTANQIVFQGYGFGTPTYINVPGSAKIAGLKFNGTTFTAEYIWRVPSDVDKRQPIHPRILWTTSQLGTTMTATWQIFYQTITSASTLATSPTTVLNRTIAASSNGSASVAPVLNLTSRGAITPIATGSNAGQVLQDNTEAIHFTIQPTSTTLTMPTSTDGLFLLGMDLEYTPRNTFGDGSHREGRKTETNLGFSEIGATNNY